MYDGDKDDCHNDDNSGKYDNANYDTIVMTTMAIMMTPMMAREMTVIMIRDAPVPHQCITVSTISSS